MVGDTALFGCRELGADIVFELLLSHCLAIHTHRSSTHLNHYFIRAGQTLTICTVHHCAFACLSCIDALYIGLAKTIHTCGVYTVILAGNLLFA